MCVCTSVRTTFMCRCMFMCGVNMQVLMCVSNVHINVRMCVCASVCAGVCTRVCIYNYIFMTHLFRGPFYHGLFFPCIILHIHFTMA